TGIAPMSTLDMTATTHPSSEKNVEIGVDAGKAARVAHDTMAAHGGVAEAKPVLSAGRFHLAAPKLFRRRGLEQPSALEGGREASQVGCLRTRAGRFYGLR